MHECDFMIIYLRYAYITKSPVNKRIEDLLLDALSSRTVLSPPSTADGGAGSCCWPLERWSRTDSSQRLPIPKPESSASGWEGP